MWDFFRQAREAFSEIFSNNTENQNEEDEAARYQRDVYFAAEPSPVAAHPRRSHFAAPLRFPFEEDEEAIPRADRALTNILAICDLLSLDPSIVATLVEQFENYSKECYNNTATISHFDMNQLALYFYDLPPEKQQELKTPLINALRDPAVTSVTKFNEFINFNLAIEQAHHYPSPSLSHGHPAALPRPEIPPVISSTTLAIEEEEEEPEPLPTEPVMEALTAAQENELQRLERRINAGIFHNPRIDATEKKAFNTQLNKAILPSTPAFESRKAYLLKQIELLEKYEKEEASPMLSLEKFKAFLNRPASSNGPLLVAYARLNGTTSTSSTASAAKRKESEKENNNHPHELLLPLKKSKNH